MTTLRKKSILKLKIILIVGILTLVSSTPIFTAKQISSNNTYTNNKLINNDEFKFSFELSDIIQNQVTTEQGVFTMLQIPNSGFVGEIGQPQLPIWTRLYAVPNTDVTLEIIESNIHESRYVGKIYPIQQPLTDSELKEKSEFSFDKEFYKNDITYPNSIAEIIETGIIRDIPFVRIVFYPVQYNPKLGIATIYDRITIKLTCTNIENVLVESNFKQAPFYRFYENVFNNWEIFEKNIIVEQEPILTTGSRDSGAEFLIITHSDFYEQAKELEEWKHIKGFITKLVNVTDIGSSAQDIRQYIQNAFDTWNPCPSYLILIGDDEYIPTNFEYSAASDLWYATVNGTDYYPDIFYGRISVDNSTEADIIIQKILKYEMNPPSLDSFYNDFTVAAYFQDDENNGYETRRFVRTSEEVRDYLLSEDYNGERVYCTEPHINPTHYNDGPYGNGEPLPAELLRPTFAWDGDADDIINAIEQGIFILNHRDHGFEDGWGDPYFDSNHVEGLNNSDLLPVVFSINCLTGKFDGYECFCEKFIRKEDGGAVAAFGATRVSYSGYNDYLCRGMYDAQWPDFDQDVGSDAPLYSLGEILNYGKSYMADTWGDPWGYERLTFELFHCFGDPSMHIWTAIPQNLTVEHSPLIPYGPCIFDVTVKSQGKPVEGAMICLYQPNGIYAKGVTDSSGVAELEVEVALPDEVILTVTAHNHLYYQINIQVGTSLPPYTPTVDGTVAGKPGKEYEYTAVTTDPEEDQIFYKFDWGDETSTDWVGPYNSGQEIKLSHAWTTVGNYSVKARAKDINDSISYWSEPYPVQIVLPVIEIGSINGGFLKITSEIKNPGIAEADDINWKISLDGGFILLGKVSQDTIDTIPAGGEQIVSSKQIIGFGNTRVTMRVDIPEGTKEWSRGGFIYIFYIQVNPGGT